MKLKTPVVFLLTTFICLLVNLSKHYSLLIIIANTLLFLGYAYSFKEVIASSRLVVLPFLAWMPIFAYDHIFTSVYVAEVLFLLTSFLATKIKKFSSFWFLLTIIIYLYFNLLANHLVRFPFQLQKEMLLYPQNEYQVEINRQQNEFWPLAYNLVLVLFNNKTTYSYVFISNIFTFLSLENLYRTVSLANAFLIILGLYHLKKLKPTFRYLVIITVTISLLVVGLIKTPDSMRPYSSLRGILLLLSLNGFNQKISWKVYLAVFGLSLLVNIA